MPALLSYFTLLIFFALIGDRRCSSTSAAAATGIYTSPPSSWGFSMQREILIPFSVSVAARSSRVSCQSGRSFSAPSFLFLQAWGGVSGFRPSCVHQLFFVLPFRLSGSPPPRRGLIFVACRIFLPTPIWMISFPVCAGFPARSFLSARPGYFPFKFVKEISMPPPVPCCLHIANTAN